MNITRLLGYKTLQCTNTTAFSKERWTRENSVSSHNLHEHNFASHLRNLWRPLKKIPYICRELTWNCQPVRNKNKENTRQRKTITRTRQYLRGSAICLHPQSCRNFTIIREKIQSATVQFFSLSKTTTTNPNHQNCVFYILHTRFTMGYKTGKKIFPGALPPNPQEACPWALRAQASKNLPLKSTQHYSS